MNNYTVTVTGSTGKTGRHVITQALQRGWRVRAASRRDGGQGEWVPMNWSDQNTWAPAFTGSDAAYIVLPAEHPGILDQAPAMLRTAADAGVKKIVLLSAMDVDTAPAGTLQPVAEQALRELPVQWAIVRPTWFMDNFTTGGFAAMTAAGHLRFPTGEGRLPFVDSRDLAAVAIAALAEDGPAGILPVTGPQAITHSQVAASLTAALSRRIEYTSIPAEDFVTDLTAMGFPLEHAWHMANTHIQPSTGQLLVPVTDTVERVTGSRAYTFEDFAQHHARTAH
ncbi:NAD(P)H-binding protein [Streptomyces sp. cg36]|uniref:NAD(P)H-binding protein n=1 Tax=Streptomyces sp. cg36 TaxID=3238798 RepID=UPI0034E2BCFE